MTQRNWYRHSIKDYKKLTTQKKYIFLWNSMHPSGMKNQKKNEKVSLTN